MAALLVDMQPVDSLDTYLPCLGHLYLPSSLVGRIHAAILLHVSTRFQNETQLLRILRRLAPRAQHVSLYPTLKAGVQARRSVDHLSNMPGVCQPLFKKKLLQDDEYSRATLAALIKDEPLHEVDPSC